LKHFELLLIDGTEVDPENYELSSGSVIVSLVPEYLNTLAKGKHDLTFVFDDGTIETSFMINETKPDSSGYKAPLTGIE